MVFTVTRCDSICKATKLVKKAQEQKMIFDLKAQEAWAYKLQYDKAINEAKTAKLSQREYEKQATEIYSGISLNIPLWVAYAWWDEWLTWVISKIETTWLVITWFTWRVNSDWKSKHKSELCYTDCTFTWVLQRYWLPTQPFIDNEIKYWVKKELSVCIAWADSHLGRALKSTNNIWNVGNNDRWQVVHYKTIWAWIEAMYRVLNNRYLWHKQTVWSLSVWGGGSKPYYATSPENWNNNVLNCLNTILDPSITEERVFRVE